MGLRSDLHLIVPPYDYGPFFSLVQVFFFGFSHLELKERSGFYSAVFSSCFSPGIWIEPRFFSSDPEKKLIFHLAVWLAGRPAFPFPLVQGRDFVIQYLEERISAGFLSHFLHPGLEMTNKPPSLDGWMESELG